MTKPPSKTIKPNRFLGDKVPSTGGPSPEEAITKALSLGNELIDAYQGWAVDDLQALWEEYEAVSPVDGQARTHIRKLYDMAHEIRGQGGSFGFPIISILGDSLCKYIGSRETLSQSQLEVIRLHILAMKAVFRQGLKGEHPALQVQLTELFAKLRNP